MRQKVGIAIALANKAEALLLDEPTSGVNTKASNGCSGPPPRSSATRCVAVLMATHDLFRAKEAGAPGVIIEHGRLAGPR